MRRIYQFKFYLNASHYVIFNGERGELHPHTWEFSCKILLLSDELVPFDVYERELERVFEPYQNQTINEVAPFDSVLPTLESLVEILGKKIRVVAAGLDAYLLEIEGSETPTRSYLIDFEEDMPRVGQAAPAEQALPVAPNDPGAVFDRLLEDL